MQITTRPTRAETEDWQRAEGRRRRKAEKVNPRGFARVHAYLSRLCQQRYVEIMRRWERSSRAAPTEIPAISALGGATRQRRLSNLVHPVTAPSRLHVTDVTQVCRLSESSAAPFWAFPSTSSLEDTTTFCTYREVCVYFLAIYDNFSSQPVSPTSAPSPRAERTVSSCCRSPLLASSPDCLPKAPAICQSTRAL